MGPLPPTKCVFLDGGFICACYNVNGIGLDYFWDANFIMIIIIK